MATAELGGEGDREQEAEDYLDAEPGHPQFLEQLGQVPVVAFGPGLAGPVAVGHVLVTGVLCGHDPGLPRPGRPKRQRRGASSTHGRGGETLASAPRSAPPLDEVFRCDPCHLCASRQAQPAVARPIPPLAPITTTVCLMSLRPSLPARFVRRLSAGGGAAERPRRAPPPQSVTGRDCPDCRVIRRRGPAGRALHSSISACTKACGRLPRSCLRSPSAIGAYSRSTCGGNASAIDGTVTAHAHLLRHHRLPVRGVHKPAAEARHVRREGVFAGRRDGWGRGMLRVGQARGERDVWSPACPVGELGAGERAVLTTGGASRPAGNRRCQPAGGEPAVPAGRRGTGGKQGHGGRAGQAARRTPSASAVPEPLLPPP